MTKINDFIENENADVHLQTRRHLRGHRRQPTPVSKVSLRPVHHGRNVAGRRLDGSPGADVIKLPFWRHDIQHNEI
jgi:hypothetical protein